MDRYGNTEFHHFLAAGTHHKHEFTTVAAVIREGKEAAQMAEELSAKLVFSGETA